MELILRDKTSKKVLTGRTVVLEILSDVELVSTEELIINFDGIEVVSQSFLNELFKQIYLVKKKLPDDYLGMNEYIEGKVRSELKRLSEKIIPNLTK